MIDPPDYETARRAHFERELRERARVWLPEWQPRDRDIDLAGAVFGITARLAGEVAQRLNRIPEKNFRGLLHWLGIRGEAGRAARVPVVFEMTAGADAVRAERGVQVQAAGLEEPVVFETVEPMTVTPSVVTSLLATDPSVDAYFSAPPGLLSLDLPQGQLDSWGVVVDAPASSRKLQLDPPSGLTPGLVLESEEPSPRQFTVLAVADGLCEIDPAVGEEHDENTGGLKQGGRSLPANTRMKRVKAFAPFGGTARDAQQHAVYIGAKKTLDIEAKAVLSLLGWEELAGYQWSFWGKVNDSDKPGWINMDWKLTQRQTKVLLKPRGKIEETEINKIKSRWLRGLCKSLPNEREPRSLVPLKVFINCDPDEPSPPVEIEGVANAAPLVLNTEFYPLGREPRLFDAFYLGSRDAFSKPRARVTAHFTFGDAWSSPPAAATNTKAGAGNPIRHALFAVGMDSALRVVEVVEINNDSTVKFHSPPQPPDGAGHFLKLRAGARPGVCHQGDTTHASVFAGKEVWLWKSQDDKFPEGSWEPLGRPVDQTPTNGNRDQTLLTRNGADTALYVYALVQGKLLRRESVAGAEWQPQSVAISTVRIELASVVPLVNMDAAAGTPHDQDGLLGVGADGRLYLRDGVSTWTDITPAGYRADTQIYPSFFQLPGSASRRVIFAVKTQDTPALHMLVQLDPAGVVPIKQSEDIQLRGTAIEVFARGTAVVTAFTLVNAGVASPAQWDPNSTVSSRVVPIGLPPGPGDLTQGPARAGARLMFPGSRGVLRVMTFDASAHADDPNATVFSAALLESSANLVSTEKYRLDTTPAEPEEKQVAVVEREVVLEENRGFALILDDAGVTTNDRAAVALYRDQNPTLFTGTIDSQDRLRIASTDTITDVGMMVFINWVDAGVAHDRLLRVLARSGDRMVLGVSFPAAASTVQYVPVDKVADLTATLRPALEVDAKFGGANATFTFPDLEPVRQKFLVGAPHADATKRWVVLREAWSDAPDGPAKMSADALNVHIKDGQPPRGNNPLLSWEFWDGSSWWRIPGLTDSTDSFVTSGDVEFCVPENIAETEVAGRKNFWVRARLLGGDYGRESVKLETDSTGKVQTVTRSTENIRAPLVNQATVTYRLCCPVIPDNVLTEDGGDFVNHSAANAEPDTKIRAFVPLSVTGDRRAVYVGFDAPPGAQSMSLLFVLEEGSHFDAYPLRAEMRRANGFELIDCQDATRGLSETGIVKLQFEAPPLKVGMFGRSQHWVRLLPREGFDPEKWLPVIRGVYANAAIAEAHETQRNEMLGSSDGRPGLRVTLARTPVVQGSLVVRVRERLSDEEIEELLKHDASSVVTRLAEREGPWVLWKERTDLLSSGPGERVFAFEDDTGDITFGDGVHGMIPPVGRDCIVAESYQRGGGEVANQVTRRTAASLITPLQGVERAAFAGDAIGGSKPDDAERTLRLAPDRLSRRERLLTLADIERAALEFSVDAAQASARRAAGGVELLLVMSGSDPLPSADLRRGLARKLAGRASPDLAVAGAIRVRRPDVLPIKIKVRLNVDDLADADQVRTDCEQCIVALLNPRDGGFDRQGWRLGVLPNQTDIAACIEDVKNIAALTSINIEAARVSATHLVRLADDDLRIEIDLSPEAVA
ncbi:MAG TPA: hypothetical protein PKE27_08795 [Povalibacter sp.]|uniref:hypothetical protein n=1 Tax=Povalibacter sp. TaxID=1962978 RepID=UPI002C5224DA|nr:hypothetical protein [Povalibacter sp.]HMN44656.1 hypothetical protein [Povalibacter sp.]